ncbi:hypothetical protein ABW20_dc0107289 [Dactylellina cionopaga]|nr:hypothetical protein ABW20_dc0107289 [Dactylellina cionopaga]
MINITKFGSRRFLLACLWSAFYLTQHVSGAQDPPPGPPRVQLNEEFTIEWEGRLIAMVHDTNLANTAPDYLDRPNLIDGNCLLDGSRVGVPEHQPVGFVSLYNSDVQGLNVNYDPKTWRDGIHCQGDVDANRWKFVGVYGKSNERINDKVRGNSLHDYVMGFIMNVKTERCLSLVRDEGSNPDGLIEQTDHRILSEECDPTAKDVRQMWMIYLTEQYQPFGPLVPANEAAPCFAEPRADGSDIGRVPGGVYAEYVRPDHLRRVDARYLALSTMEMGDAARISPKVMCTGQKWYFDPPFELGSIKRPPTNWPPKDQTDVPTGSPGDDEPQPTKSDKPSTPSPTVDSSTAPSPTEDPPTEDSPPQIPQSTPSPMPDPDGKSDFSEDPAYYDSNSTNLEGQNDDFDPSVKNPSGNKSGKRRRRVRVL